MPGLPMLNLGDTTVVILDTSCLGRLQDPALRTAVSRSARATGQTVLPTAVNVLEVLKAKSPKHRRGLLQVVTELQRDRPVITWPHQLLRHVAEAIARRERYVTVSPGLYDALVEQADELSDAELDAGAKWLNDLEKEFDETHQSARPAIQEFLQERRAVRWENAAEFLDEVWSRPAILGDIVRRLWVDSFGLPPDRLDVELVLANDPWRLFLDGWGVAVFERAMLPNQPKRVGATDLAQLTYLGISSKRILVTRDASLLRAAQSVLRGRYDNALALHLDRFIAGVT